MVRVRLKNSLPVVRSSFSGGGGLGFWRQPTATRWLIYIYPLKIPGKSPDEWATTKQACRDELVVSLSFSSIYM